MQTRKVMSPKRKRRQQTLHTQATKYSKHNMVVPLPPKMSNRFSTMVAVCPHLGGGTDPVTDNSVHSSDTV